MTHTLFKSDYIVKRKRTSSLFSICKKIYSKIIKPFNTLENVWNKKALYLKRLLFATKCAQCFGFGKEHLIKHILLQTGQVWKHFCVSSCEKPVDRHILTQWNDQPRCFTYFKSNLNTYLTTGKDSKICVWLPWIKATASFGNSVILPEWNFAVELNFETPLQRHSEDMDSILAGGTMLDQCFSSISGLNLKCVWLFCPNYTESEQVKFCRNKNKRLWRFTTR